mgnify:CR=1 FL=1
MVWKREDERTVLSESHLGSVSGFELLEDNDHISYTKPSAPHITYSECIVN